MQWFRTFPDLEYEGIVCALSRNGGDVVYSLSGSSVYLLGDEDNEEEDRTEVNDDQPEETIDLDGLEINRRDFFEFIDGDSTCHICGTDLEFKSGHIVDNECNFICVDCKDLDLVKQYVNDA